METRWKAVRTLGHMTSKLYLLDYNNTKEWKSFFGNVGGGVTNGYGKGRVKFTFFNGTTSPQVIYLQSDIKGQYVVTSIVTHGSDTRWYDIEGGEKITVQYKDTNISCSEATFYPYK